MIIKGHACNQHCNNCNQDVKLDLAIPENHSEIEGKGWAWICQGCGTRIVQKITSIDPFIVATEIIRSRVKG